MNNVVLSLLIWGFGAGFICGVALCTFLIRRAARRLQQDFKAYAEAGRDAFAYFQGETNETRQR